MKSRSEHSGYPPGFTLLEVMIVVAILGILVSAATVSYSYFVMKAQELEGELVVHEVERLQYLYHTTHQSYSDMLDELGFSVSGQLRYYQPEVRIGKDLAGINYQVRAVPMNASSPSAWLLTSFSDGSLLVDRVPVSDLGLFASVRYGGVTTPALTSSEAMSIYSSGEGTGIIEPEWNTTGASSRCQECGRVVIHQRATR